MGAPVAVDCQQSASGFTLHYHRVRIASVRLCQTRLSDSLAVNLASNNTSRSRAAARPPNNDQRFQSAEPANRIDYCGNNSPRTAGQACSQCLRRLRASFVALLLAHPDAPRPPHTPATNTQRSAAHQVQRAPRRQICPASLFFHSIQVSCVSNGWI